MNCVYGWFVIVVRNLFPAPAAHASLSSGVKGDEAREASGSVVKNRDRDPPRGAAMARSFFLSWRCHRLSFYTNSSELRVVHVHSCVHLTIASLLPERILLEKRDLICFVPQRFSRA